MLHVVEAGILYNNARLKSQSANSVLYFVNQLIFSTICTLVVKPAQHALFLFVTESAAQDGVPRLHVRARPAPRSQTAPETASFP